MEEIKLNVIFERPVEVKAYVNKDDVKFVGDYALVKAFIQEYIQDDITLKAYSSYGLIDKDFNEVLFNSYSFEKYLMFLSQEKEVTRINEFDFIVKTIEEGVDTYSHIRMSKEKKVTLLNTFTSKEESFSENIFNTGVSLYDIELNEFITPNYSCVYKINNDEVKRYLVTDKIISNDEEHGKAVDFFRFVIDEKGNIVSPIYSSRNHSWYTSGIIKKEDYNNIKHVRQEELNLSIARSEKIENSLKLGYTF